MGLDAVLLQAGIDAELPRESWSDLVQRDREALALGVGDDPRVVAASTSVLGAFIQFSGLYAPPSAWIATQPSAFTMISRMASGRWADSRPA